MEITVNELTMSMDYLQGITNAEYIIAGDLNVNYNRRDTKGFNC